MPVEEIHDMASLERQLTGHRRGLIVICFNASKDEPCHMILTLFELLKTQFEQVLFLQANLGQADEIAQKYKVVMFPTTTFIQAGAVVKSLTGTDLVAIASNVEKYALNPLNLGWSQDTSNQNWAYVLLWASIVYYYQVLQRCLYFLRMRELPASVEQTSDTSEANGGGCGTTLPSQLQANSTVAHSSAIHPVPPSNVPLQDSCIRRPGHPKHIDPSPDASLTAQPGPSSQPTQASPEPERPSQPNPPLSPAARADSPVRLDSSTKSSQLPQSGLSHPPETLPRPVPSPQQGDFSVLNPPSLPHSNSASEASSVQLNNPETQRFLGLRGFPSMRNSSTLRRIHSALHLPASTEPPQQGTSASSAPTISLSAQALEMMWDSNALRDAEDSWLPPQYAVDDALAKLLLTFKSTSVNGPKAIPSVGSPRSKKDTRDSQSLMIYCPLEGGEYVIDATVKELARRTGAQTLVIDPAHIAAGKWGSFGEAASGLERKYKLPYGLTTQEKLAMSRSKSEEGEQKGRKYCPWCIGRLRKGDHDICQLCFLFQLVLSSNPLPSGLHGSPLPDITYVSGNCPRIIYVRDIGVATEWASDLVEALQAASSKIQSSTLGECPIASTPIAVILGYSPPLKSPTKKSPTKKSPSRRFNFDDDDSISSDSGPPGQDCGEGEAAKSLRESRVLERIKQWQDESLMQQLLPPLRLDVSLFGSNLNSSTTNSSSRHGHLRWCVVMPDNRNEDEERISRERRRKELNTLRVQLSLAAAGASFELDLTSFPGASEGLKRRWISDLIEAKVLSQVVDRTLTPPSVRIAGSEARLQVSWSSFSQAWDSYHEFETNQASWIRAEINENSFDEVFLRVKMMDLSSHERGLLQCVVNPDQIKTTFDSVHLPMETVDRIRSLVSLPLLHPEVFQCGILKQHSMTGALLFGPPGTGKTHIARAVAKESGARMIAIKPSDIQQMYVGESEKVVTAVFQLARRLMPCLIFIDEIDALFGARTNQGDSNSARYHASLITQFMQEMDGLLLSKVVVIGATNRPFDLDDAILRRLPCRVLVDLPNVKAREQILRTMLKDEHLASDVSYQDLALKTENYTGSDLKHLCVSAVLAAVKDQVNLPWMSAEGTSTSSRGAFAPSARNTRPTSTSAPSPAQGRSTSAVDVDERSDKGDIKNPPSIPIIVTPDQGLSIPNGTLLLSETHSSEVTTTHQAADKGFGGTGSISTPDQRILCYRHFAHALAEVKPSTSEAGMSVRMLRKWNAKLGTGESSK